MYKNGERIMRKIATGFFTVLLIAATTSLAMAQEQDHYSRRYYDYNGGYGAQSQPYNVGPNYYDYYDGSYYGARNRQLDVSPAAPNASIEQER
jgi:hypothetical protein